MPPAATKGTRVQGLGLFLQELMRAHRVVGEHGGDGVHAARQRLAQDQDVGLHSLVVHSQHAPGARQPRLHLHSRAALSRSSSKSTQASVHKPGCMPNGQRRAGNEDPWLFQVLTPANMPSFYLRGRQHRLHLVKRIRGTAHFPHKHRHQCTQLAFFFRP